MDNSHAFLLAGRMQRRKRRTRAGWGSTAARSDKPPSGIATRRRSTAQRTGDRGEDLALALLQAHGLHVLARNLWCALGEIDLVMRDGEVLVFVEVRARGSLRYGGAAASIGAAKRHRLLRAAAFFLPKLARQHWQGVTPRCRVDVVALEADGPVWLRGAVGDAKGP